MSSSEPNDVPGGGSAGNVAGAAASPQGLDVLGMTGSVGLFQLLVESVRDYAIFALDPNGYVLTWNTGARRIKGYEAHEIIGRHFSIFYPAERVAERFPDRELREAARDGRFEDEGWRLRKDGTRFWANVVITALRDANGTLVGFAKVTRDLTERRRAEERAIEDARRVAAAEAANRAKSEFLAAMSHELRTPLNAIAGYAELLALGLRGPVTEDQRADLDRIRRSQQHLSSIINDLLNYSRIEAGQLTFDVGPVRVGEMLDSVVAMLAPQAAAKELALELEPCPPEYELQSDRTRIEQIVLNLVGNAIKFTPPGGRITLTCLPGDARVRIDVADTGIGIPADKQESIFEPFVQVGRTLSRPGDGTGLGLAISRDLARAMGGELTVRSEVNVGSTFSLTLPRVTQTQSAPRSAPPAP